MLFSPWSLVSPARYKRVFYCKENSSYPSLLKTELFLILQTLEKQSLLLPSSENFGFHTSPIHLLLPAHLQDVILITLSTSFCRAFPCPHSGGWLPSIPRNSKEHLPACRSIHFLAVLAPSSDAWLARGGLGGVVRYLGQHPCPSEHLVQDDCGGISAINKVGLGTCGCVVGFKGWRAGFALWGLEGRVCTFQTCGPGGKGLLKVIGKW